MIDFIQEGTKITLTISGIGGAIVVFSIFFLLLSEFVFRLNGISMLRAIIIWFGVREWLRKNIPNHYSTKHNFLTIKVSDESCLPLGGVLYSVYSEIRVHEDLIPPHNHNWTNDFLLVDKKGNVISESLTIKMKDLDNKIDPGELKAFQREGKLKELGI